MKLIYIQLYLYTVTMYYVHMYNPLDTNFTLCIKQAHVVSAVYNSYTMAVRDFSDIYTQSPNAAGPRAAGVYVSKIPRCKGYISLGAHSPNR